MVDITGDRFGRLAALNGTNKRGSDGSIIWLCQCDCGNLTNVRLSKEKK